MHATATREGCQKRCEEASKCHGDVRGGVAKARPKCGGQGRLDGARRRSGAGHDRRRARGGKRRPAVGEGFGRLGGAGGVERCGGMSRDARQVVEGECEAKARRGPVSSHSRGRQGVSQGGEGDSSCGLEGRRGQTRAAMLGGTQGKLENAVAREERGQRERAIGAFRLPPEFPITVAPSHSLFVPDIARRTAS